MWTLQEVWEIAVKNGELWSIEEVEQRIKSLEESVAFSSSTQVYKLLKNLKETSGSGKFYVGEDLRKLCEEHMALCRRDAYFEVEAFMNKPDTLRTVGIIYGMRSTGKTVIMRQLAGREEFLEISAYATLSYGEYDIGDIYKWISELYKKGVRYFYVDEVTWANGFIDRAMEFADVWASYRGVKIVLSGTDSLAFTFAKQESLHGRYEQFTTTMMSYPEYSRILDGDILEYVHSGGVFWKENPPDSEAFEEYLDSSVVRNIYNSILGTRRMTMMGEELRFVSLKELYAICHGVCICVAIQYLYGHVKDSWEEPLVKALDMILKNCGISIPLAERNALLPYAPVFKAETSVYDREKVDAVIEIMRKIGFLMDVEVKSDLGLRLRPMFTQVGVAREFALQAIRAVVKGSAVKQLSTSAAILNSIEGYTDGELLDLACVITFMKRAAECGQGNISVAKYRSYAGDDEIDVVVFDHRDNALYLHEIKRSTRAKADYAKHLANERLVEHLKTEYGAISVQRAVLYRGVDLIHPSFGDVIPYRNIESYLKRIERGELF